MEDIIATMPWQCGDSDCDIGWHLANYWLDDDGEYTVDSYSDGNHEPIDLEDVPIDEEVKGAWEEYYQYCITTGEDPLCEFYGRTVKTIRHWQFIISPSILGPVLAGVRRARCNGKGIYGRGPWVYGENIPNEVKEYLLINKTGRGCSDPEFADYKKYLFLLVSAPEIIPQRYNRYILTIKRTKYLAPSKKEIRARARKLLRLGGLTK